MENEHLVYRKAIIDDVKPVHKMIAAAAAEDLMLPRSLSDLYEKLRDFHVCTNAQRILGCCALHIVWENIAEIRSLAVDPDCRGAGIGIRLAEKCIAECHALKINRVIVLTYIPAYFAKLGFVEVSKDVLPHKIWADCVKCPKFPDCGEIAMALDFKT